jgi:hypothetical protein
MLRAEDAIRGENQGETNERRFSSQSQVSSPAGILAMQAIIID